MINFKTNQLRQWKNLDEDKKHSWLRECYEYSNSIDWKIEPKKEIIIDGRCIDSKNSFLCEFSEHLLGVGGYFGSDLDGFEDCFNNFYSIEKSVKVRWYYFQDSLVSFQNNFHLSQILEILTLQTELLLFTDIPFADKHFSQQ